VIRRVFLRQAMKRITVSMAAGMPRTPYRTDDVEGTAVDVDARPGTTRPGLEA